MVSLAVSPTAERPYLKMSLSGTILPNSRHSCQIPIVQASRAKERTAIMGGVSKNPPVKAVGISPEP